jgi:hypothetical protein
VATRPRTVRIDIQRSELQNRLDYCGAAVPPTATVKGDGQVTDAQAGDGQRASDADRDRVVSVLNEALASGCLSQSEHSDRIDMALSARRLAS